MEAIVDDEIPGTLLKTRSCSLPGDPHFDQQDLINFNPGFSDDEDWITFNPGFSDGEAENELDSASSKVPHSEGGEALAKSSYLKIIEFEKKTRQVVKSYQIKMESEKKKHLVFKPLDFHNVEVDPICGIESAFIRMRLKNEYYSLPLCVPIHRNTLLMILDYCKKRAKIILQHSALLQFKLPFLDSLAFTAQKKQQLKEFDSKFLQSIHQYPNHSHRLILDVFAAAVYLHIKSLYNLVLDDAAAICDQWTPKQILNTFEAATDRYLWNVRSPRWFGWAFTINRTHNVDN